MRELARQERINPLKISSSHLIGSEAVDTTLSREVEEMSIPGFQIWVDLGALDQGSDSQDVTHLKDDESIDLRVELRALHQHCDFHDTLLMIESQGKEVGINSVGKNFEGDNEKHQKRVRFSDHIIIHSIPAQEEDEEGNEDYALATEECISKNPVIIDEKSPFPKENSLPRKESEISRGKLLTSPKDILQAMDLIDDSNESCNEKCEPRWVIGLENSGNAGSSSLCANHMTLATPPMLDLTSTPNDGRSRMIRTDEDCPSTVSKVHSSMNHGSGGTPIGLTELHKSDIEKDDSEMETVKIFLQDLTYNVDRFYALNPILCKVPRPRLNATWNIQFSEDVGKLTFKREVRARKRSRAEKKEVSRVSGSIEGKIQSDDLEEDDNIYGRPEWMRQYRSINALVS